MLKKSPSTSNGQGAAIEIRRPSEFSPILAKRERQLANLADRRERVRDRIVELIPTAQALSSSRQSEEVLEAVSATAARKSKRVSALLGEDVAASELAAGLSQPTPVNGEFVALETELSDIDDAWRWLEQEIAAETTPASALACAAVRPQLVALFTELLDAAERFSDLYGQALAVGARLDAEGVRARRAMLPAISPYLSEVIGAPALPNSPIARLVREIAGQISIHKGGDLAR